MVLCKLPAIKGDLVRSDSGWETWNYVQFTEALRQWTKRNRVREDVKSDELTNRRDRRNQNPSGFYQTKQERTQKTNKTRPCVYCDGQNQSSIIRV